MRFASGECWSKPLPVPWRDWDVCETGPRVGLNSVPSLVSDVLYHPHHMATPREIRRLAFQTLFQLDARPTVDQPEVRTGLEAAEGYTEGDRRKAFDLATAAYTNRSVADAAMLELAPGWPAHRQAAADRAILRLAHYEMTAKSLDPNIAISEAVELAKEFSTEKSPAFVNALLDKVAKKLPPHSPASSDA